MYIIQIYTQYVAQVVTASTSCQAMSTMANQLSEARETASMLGLEMPAPHEAERRPSVRSPLGSAVPRGVRWGLGESHGKRLQDVGWIGLFIFIDQFLRAFWVGDTGV